MKKGIGSLFLIFVLLLGLCIPASAAGVDANNDNSASQWRFVQFEDQDGFISLSTKQDAPQFGRPDSLASVAAVWPGVSRAYPEHFIVTAVVEEGGEYLVPDFGWIFEPVDGIAYMAETMSYTQQEQLNEAVRALGYEPIGWYIQGSYYLETYNPKVFQYHTLSHDGKSPLLGRAANNGSNVFGVFGLYPKDTSVTYRYGIEGNLLYDNYYAGDIIAVTMPIELTVRFTPY